MKINVSIHDKPHIDIYVPASEAVRLREMLEKVK